MALTKKKVIERIGTAAVIVPILVFYLYPWNPLFYAMSLASSGLVMFEFWVLCLRFSENLLQHVGADPSFDAAARKNYYEHDAAHHNQQAKAAPLSSPRGEGGTRRRKKAAETAAKTAAVKAAPAMKAPWKEAGPWDEDFWVLLLCHSVVCVCF